MTTTLLDEFDLDIQLAALDPQQIGMPVMASSARLSEPCCSDWTCPIDCKPTKYDC